MSSEHSERAIELFRSAVRLDANERDAFLAQACAGDERLRAEVEELLRVARAGEEQTLVQPAELSRFPEADLQPGEILAKRFRIVRYIDAGGMGVVYEAEDLALGEAVALKTVRSDLANATTIERFKREIYLARKVTHPNVCRTFDLAEDTRPDGTPILFLTMELLKGETLSSRIRRSGPMSTEDALPLISQIAGALDAAHQAGIVHRDLKTGNVILVPSGNATRAVVTDFGLAYASRSESEFLKTISTAGHMTGTPLYMAPEQVQGLTVTPATDIYAFGVVIYEMLTRTFPFTGQNALEVANKRLLEDPTPPSRYEPELNRRWEKAILRCLERAPEDRFASTSDVVEFLEGRSVKAARRQKRRRLLVASCALALGALAIPAYLLFPKRAAAKPTVAVLGFQNIASRQDVAWVGTALSDGLRTELGASDKLRTVSGEDTANYAKDINIQNFGSLSKETLHRLHRLGADIVVVGSYTDLPGTAGKIRLNLVIQDAGSGETTSALAADGTENDISQLVSQIGTRLRTKLKAGDLSPEKERELALAQPNPEVAPLYSEAVLQLRTYNLSAARELLQKAIAADPNYAFSHAALAETWSKLGFDERAREEAKRASELSAGLSLQDRLSIEGRSKEMRADWNGAIQSYSELYSHYPDDLSYGLDLARAQMFAAKGMEAMQTLAGLRKLPPPKGNDPRIDLQQAETAASISDYKTAQTSALSAISAARSREMKVLQLRALNWACPAFRHRGQQEQAREFAKSAIDISTQIGDSLGMARAFNCLANVDNDQGDTNSALTLFERAFKITSKIGARRDMSGALNNIGMIFAGQGRLSDARRKYEEALAIQREIGFNAEIPVTLSNLADLLHQQGEQAKAKDLLAQACSIARRTQNQNALALSLSNLAAISFEQGNLAEAGQQYEAALAIQKAIGARSNAAATLDSLGDLELAKGNLDRARQNYERGVSMQREMHDDSGMASSKLGLARVLIEQQAFQQAEDNLHQALSEFEREKDGDAQAMLHSVLASSYFRQKNLVRAEQEIRIAGQLIGNGSGREARYAVAIMTARISGTRSSANTQVLADLGKTEVDAKQAGMMGYELEARLARCQIELGLGRKATAEKSLRLLREDALRQGFGLIARKAQQLNS